MSAEQLKERCWVIPEGDPADATGSHYPTEAEAQGAIAGECDCGDGEVTGAADGHKATCASVMPPLQTVRQLPEPCWVVFCDELRAGESGCGAQLENDDEGWLTHASTLADAVYAAELEGWTVLGDARTFCRVHEPEEPEPDEWAPVENITGQLTLTGGEPA